MDGTRVCCDTCGARGPAKRTEEEAEVGFCGKPTPIEKRPLPKLESCPFCGDDGIALLMRYRGYSARHARWEAQYHCCWCKARGGIGEGNQSDEAIQEAVKAWNRRGTEDE